MSTFRADVVTQLLAVANTYKTSNPSRLRRVWSARPGSWGELPCLYIGSRTETSPDDDTGTVTRFLSAEIVIVDALPDNEQTTDRMDVLVDALATAYRSNANATFAGGIIDAVSNVSDGEITTTNPTSGISTTWRAAYLTITAHIQEGRP